MKQKTFIDTLYYRLMQFPFFRHITEHRQKAAKSNKNNANFPLVYKIEDLNEEYYEKIRNNNENTELEHQIGRLKNMKKIIAECIPFNGDFIEFGTWKGFSLLWIAYFLERNAIFNKKLVGLDGFIGLPDDDGPFHKGSFSDTSLKTCINNISNNRVLYEETRKNILINKFLFNQKEEILSYFHKNNISKFCFIHIDSDIYQSISEIFAILREGDCIANKAYILFDDYGWNSKLAPTVDEIFENMRSEWDISIHSKTRLTKNFFLQHKEKQ